MPTLMNKPIRFLPVARSTWQRYDTAQEAEDAGIDIDENHAEYPQYLVAMSHLSTRQESDVIAVCISIGEDGTVVTNWHWAVHGVVNIVDTSYYETQGYDYGDIYGALQKLGYDEDSDVVTQTQTELQEMVTLAREEIGLP